jgi:tripeptidyl-peptidase-1
MESGIESERIILSKGRNWFKVNVTVEEAESLLKTQYHVYTNVQTGKDHLACDEYSVPIHIKEHIDFITPTIHFGRYRGNSILSIPEIFMILVQNPVSKLLKYD